MRCAVLLLACAVAAVAAVAGLGCGGDGSPSSRDARSRPAEAARPEAVPAATRSDEARRRERPLPAFAGYTVQGERLDVSTLIGRRLLLVFFNPEVAESKPVAEAVVSLSPLRTSHNFEIVGVGVGASRSSLEAFIEAQGIDFRVIDDSTADIASRLGLRTPVSAVGVDAEGFVVFAAAQFPGGPKASQAIQAELRRALRLPEQGSDSEPLLGSRPPAPPFRVTAMERDEPAFSLAEHAGEPVVLIFFLHTCPHCHRALAFLRETLEALPEKRRPRLVGVEVTGRHQAVRRELAEQKLDFFPVYFDVDRSAREAFGVFAGVPVTVLIDAQGRIAARVEGWVDEKNGPLMRMRIAQIAGTSIPMLLRTRGYSGSEVCGVCHAQEYETWSLTTHSKAFDTLVQHGAERDEECIGCHVVGHGQPGGFVDSARTPDLEHVGCESCHGRGGPHLSPEAVTAGSYEKGCKTCHDPKHSLGFRYATFLPKVSHAANAHLAALPLAEKQKILEERGKLRTDLLPTRAAYVGSESCQGCHPAEYETWARGGHARALDSLRDRDAAAQAECLVCHTTGYGKPGGFPAEAAAAQHPDLARVGCESCHGPGGDHVAEGATRLGSIVSLGDKCDSCVILQICGGCHDQANDPGFEFEVQEKIERQRHGTIEAGTGRPKGPTAGLDGTSADASRDRAHIAQALARLAEGG